MLDIDTNRAYKHNMSLMPALSLRKESAAIFVSQLREKPMATQSSTLHSSENTNVWLNLQRAICSSAGFQRWKSELPIDTVDKISLEQLVRRYLRETLETLAY